MDLFWKAVAGILIAAFLGLAVGKDVSMLLSVAVCVMGATILSRYMEPVLELINQLTDMANIPDMFLNILLKAIAISLVTEIASMICNESGCAALGKMIKLLGYSTMLWLSIPAFQALISILTKLTGEL